MQSPRLLPLALLILSSAAFGAQPVTWTTQPVLIDTGPASWVRMAKLPDGSWLAAYTIETPQSFIVVKRSYDKMRTWTQVSTIAENGRLLDNATLGLLPNGTVLMALRSVIVGQSYWIETYSSSDSGNTFTYQSQVDWDHHVGGVYEPYLYYLPNGNLLCFYTAEIHQYETPAYSQTLSEKVSTDGGYTWGPEILAIAQPGAARPGEANIVPLPGTVLALFYEMCGTENCVGHESFSTDGVTWPGIGPALPDTFQDLQAVGTTGGLIFATSNLRDVIFSPDYANTWIDTREYPFAFGSWPGLYQTGPNEIAMVMTSAGPNNAPGAYIQFGTINVSALQPVTSVDTCREPSRGRLQNCH